MGNETYEGYTRVSAILDTYQPPQLIDWKIKTGKREAKRISTIATKIGTNVDAWIRADISGTKYPKLNSVEAENCVRAWQKFKEDYKIDLKQLKVGERLFNIKTGVCGEPDIIWYSADTVFDIKCSSAIRPIYWLQTEWYARELRCSKKAILRPDKNLGVYEYEVRNISDVDMEAFNALAVVHRYFKPDQRSDNEEEV
jgi:hypothetical protein